MSIFFLFETLNITHNYFFITHNVVLIYYQKTNIVRPKIYSPKSNGNQRIKVITKSFALNHEGKQTKTTNIATEIITQ